MDGTAGHGLSAFHGGGDSGAGAVGEYIRDGTAYDLTEDHVQTSSEGLIVEAPTGTSEIRVNPSYLRDRLGAWDADREYTVSGNRTVVADRKAAFTSFTPTTQAVFTRGSFDSIRFSDRPMWLSVEEVNVGLKITADGSTTGQDLRIARTWLGSYGIEDVIAFHENGSRLPVNETVDGTGWIVHVPHFSHIIIPDPTLDTSWKADGFTTFYDVNATTWSSEFNVTVVNTTVDAMSLRYWATVNGSDDAFDQERFNKTSRESLNRSGYYALNFINQTNLENEQAQLGGRTYNLSLLSTTSYVYEREGGNLTYHFDRDQGWLRMVEDSGTGASVGIDLWGSGTTYPTGAPGDGQAADLTDTPIVAHAKWDSANNIKEADVDPPFWSKGNSDEVVQQNLLSGRTEVNAIADYTLDADISGLSNCHDVDCHAVVHTKFFHVHWDGISERSTYD